MSNLTCVQWYKTTCMYSLLVCDVCIAMPCFCFRHMISADTKEERINWCNKINRALANIRTWHSDALRPIKMPKTKEWFKQAVYHSGACINISSSAIDKTWFWYLLTYRSDQWLIWVPNIYLLFVSFNNTAYTMIHL